jgi:hydroxymethylpyrimidine pyrophosphatase-like HAD family hydrolase
MLEKPVTVAAPQTRLLVLDVDGTVANSRHEITQATCDAVARVRAAGIRVALATGRRYRDTLPVAARLGVDGPLITASGALIKRTTDHVTLSRAEFGPGVLEGVVADIVAAGHEPVLYSDSFADGFDFHCRSLAVAPTPSGQTEQAIAGIVEYLERNRHLARVVPDLQRNLPGGVFAGFAMGLHGAMLDLESSLRDRFPGQLSLHTIRSPRYLNWMCEIAPAGVTKWSGVLALAREWGIAPAEICAVGDDVNDLPMIRGAGLGIAMGNAQPEVLAAADRIVGRHDEDGLVDVAELLLRSGQPG